jgi:DNA (cytosine-5)-methyltransferase 1
MQVAGLFSGIGGFELAFAQAGFANSLLVEIDDTATAVLKHRFPGHHLQADLLDVVDLPAGIDVLTAGFPCQNLSMAGDKSGIEGEKSGIVGKMFELIAQSRVPTIVIENVYFMLQLDRGNGMRRLVEEFEALQYRWAYRVINTIGFSLPQRRRRVYMVASREIDPRTVLFADETERDTPIEPNLEVPLGFYWTEGRTGIGLTVDGIPPLKVGSTLGIPSAPAVLFPDREVLMPSLAACEKLQGFPEGWTAAADSDGGRGSKWRLVGNAVSVPVARWIAERIKEPGQVAKFQEVSITESQRWPDAGWNIGRGRIGVKASDKPIFVALPSISTFRNPTWTRLSNRALDGFIRRAVEGGLRTPDGFLDLLRKAHRRVGHHA